MNEEDYTEWTRYAYEPRNDTQYVTYTDGISSDGNNENEFMSSQRMRELYGLWKTSQLNNPYYEASVPIGNTMIYGGLGDLNNVGYNQMYGVQQNVGPVSLGYERSHVGNDFFDEWNNKYSVGTGGKNWYASYEQQRGEGSPSHTVSTGGKIGKANVGVDFTRQGDYRDYNANVSGKIGKADASLSYHKDNQGNKKIYAMFGGRF